MYESIIKIRNSIIWFFYRFLLKPVCFSFDPEGVHNSFVKIGSFLGSNPITRGLVALKFGYQNKMLEQTVLGIKFKNPLGLAAGFDKNAELVNIIPSVGFGFEEIGSITGEPCEGNPKPRLWRIPKRKTLAVYYGLMNDGCEVLAKRLERKRFKIPIGVSIAKTNCKATVSTQRGIDDYVKAFKTMKNIGKYITINISCPNAYGGKPFTDAKKLDKLLAATDKIKVKKPVFLKIAPDLSTKEIDAIIRVVKKHNIQGFICSNLTKKIKDKELKQLSKHTQGGLSGVPAKKQSTEQIAYIYKKTKGKYIIIGCGGIFSAKDAYEKIKAGATLLQLITSMIYEGPQNISGINQGLLKLLKRDGYKNIKQAIGTK